MPGRTIRIVILLGILAWVALDLLVTRWNTTDWNESLWVGVYPVNADGSARAENYIENLDPRDFAEIEAWFVTQAARNGRTLASPVSLKLGAVQNEIPPLPPREGGILATAWWSMKLRWWADDHDALPDGLRPDIRLYLLYHDPAISPALGHSLGLQKGLVGIVNVFADRRQAGTNNMVIAHELLHTLGASDKYDPATNLPVHPGGFAEPAREPRYPQSQAEIMAGRIPLSPARSEIPAGLGEVVLGPATAAEIRW